MDFFVRRLFSAAETGDDIRLTRTSMTGRPGRKDRVGRPPNIEIWPAFR